MGEAMGEFGDERCRSQLIVPIKGISNLIKVENGKRTN
jgi:hypothetical protein